MSSILFTNITENNNNHTNNPAKKESKIEKFTELINRGVAAKRQQKYEEALQYYIEAVNLVPANGNSYYAMGKLLYIMGRYKESMNAYYLAYVNEANVYKDELYRHYGHSFVDSSKLNSSYKPYIDAYRDSICGIFSEVNSKYERRCENIGKLEFNRRIRQEQEK